MVSNLLPDARLVERRRGRGGGGGGGGGVIRPGPVVFRGAGNVVNPENVVVEVVYKYIRGQEALKKRA